MHPEAARTYSALARVNAELGVERMLRYASALIGGNQLEQAAQILDAAAPLALNAQQTAVLQARAGLHRAREEWQEARELLERVVELDPLNGQALFDLAQTAEQLGDESQATFHYEAAAQVPQQAYSANLSLANLHVKHQRYDEA